MEPTKDFTPDSLPGALLAKVQEAAEEEHRTAAEVVRDAVERYLEQRHWQRLVLSAADSRKFAETLLNPPDASPALQRAAQRRRDLLGPE